MAGGVCGLGERCARSWTRRECKCVYVCVCKRWTSLESIARGIYTTKSRQHKTTHTHTDIQCAALPYTNSCHHTARPAPYTICVYIHILHGVARRALALLPHPNVCQLNDGAAHRHSQFIRGYTHSQSGSPPPSPRHHHHTLQTPEIAQLARERIPEVLIAATACHVFVWRKEHIEPLALQSSLLASNAYNMQYIFSLAWWKKHRRRDETSSAARTMRFCVCMFSPYSAYNLVPH